VGRRDWCRERLQAKKVGGVVQRLRLALGRVRECSGGPGNRGWRLGRLLKTNIQAHRKRLSERDGRSYMCMAWQILTAFHR
jgi:hypothetical protein